jgi:hypothetical protein
MPETHLYSLSRLVHAGPWSWQRLLNEVEEGRSYASRYYQPMRDGIVQFCARRGRNADDIKREIRAQIRPEQRWPNRLADNLDGFECFGEDFFPRINRFRHSFLHQRKDPCQFEGLDVNGGPHFEVIDEHGETRHVYLHAAKWKPNDLAAYLELLGIIIETDYGGDPKSMWVMDLRSGKDVKWKSRPAMRKRCVGTAQLFAKFLRAMGDAEQ